MLKMPDLRPADRKEHPGPHHAHPGHAGRQRRADSRSAEHHPRNRRQRHVREACTAKSPNRFARARAIAKPMKEHSMPQLPSRDARSSGSSSCGGPVGLLLYLMQMKQRVVDDLVVNMVDVGEETGELDTMLYKVADTYDEEVAVLTESLVSLMEPLLIIVPGRDGRLHRHRAVHAAGQADHRPEPLSFRSPLPPGEGSGEGGRSSSRRPRAPTLCLKRRESH